MIDPRLAWFAIGSFTTLVLHGWPWHRRYSRFSRWRRSPYSSAAIAFRVTSEDAEVRSKIINPLAWEDPPKPMTVDEWARSYQFRPNQDSTPNPPPSDP